MLELRQLQAFYGPAQALFGVDLQMQAGQMVVLQGLNGAGKSTLLKSVMGLEVSTIGEVHLRSAQGQIVEIGQWSSHRRARAGLGYVAEDRRLFASLSVRDNLRVAGGARCADRMAWVLDRFALLKPMIDRRAGLMSGGEQQMLAVARTLMTEPRLLLLDEPCEGISPVLVDALVQVLLDLRAQGLALLVAEQNRVLIRSADRLLVLVAGKVQGPQLGLPEPD
jgi:branched-chain amino acid transport system ATP-binding protein